MEGMLTWLMPSVRKPFPTDGRPPYAALRPSVHGEPSRPDSAALKCWESSLLVLLLQAQDYAQASAPEGDTAGLPDRTIRLLSLACTVPERVIVALEVVAQLVTA
jgi:hypothetical protein